MEIICCWRREQDKRELRAIVHAAVLAVLMAVIAVLVVG